MSAESRCPDCGCAARMHFLDGCHTAFGSICRCARTSAEFGGAA